MGFLNIDKIEKDTLFFIITIVTFLLGLLTGACFQENTVIKTVETLGDKEKHAALSDWDMLTLAIMKTESNLNAQAVGMNSYGVLQLTPIFIEECNNLSNGETYTVTDALDPEKSIHMYNLYQGKYNPDHDIIKAIRAHNPGGASIGYTKLVLGNLEQVRTYEEMRTLVIRNNNE